MKVSSFGRFDVTLMISKAAEASRPLHAVGAMETTSVEPCVPKSKTRIPTKKMQSTDNQTEEYPHGFRV